MLPGMAKPIQVEGLEPGMPLEEAAAKMLPPYIGEAFARELAVRSGDPELGIHDMRVAMKRLREMFRLLSPAFGKKKHKRALKWIESLNDALGEVRDRDVLVEHVVELAAEDKTTPAVSALLERLLTKRDTAFQDLIEVLDLVHERGVRAKLETLVTTTAHERHAGTLGEFVRNEIRERLDRVRRRWFQAHKLASDETLHSTRIANKRLRYSIEPFRTLLPEEVGHAYETASSFHDALGDLHDCDVLLDTARTALLSTPAADRAPLLRLIERAEGERRHHLEVALTHADTLQGIEWERLEKAVAALPSPPPPEENPAVDLPTATEKS